MRLRFLADNYSVCQLVSDEPIPDWINVKNDGPIVAVLRTQEELTVVAPSHCVPTGIKSSDGWRCFRVVGEMEFDIVGVIAGISKVLAESKIPIFSLSTYDTDYFLVANDNCELAQAALTESGYEFEV